MYFTQGSGTLFQVQSSQYKLILQFPGLTSEAGTVTFQSFSEPQKYLYHNSGDNNLHIGEQSAFQSQEATFYVRWNKYHNNYVAFESVMHANRFLRHSGFVLRIHNDDGSGLFTEDASFTIIMQPSTEGGLMTLTFVF